MIDKEQMSAVKFRVRHKALRLGQFTVDQMVKETGLKRESVSTEVQRMKKEGLLVTQRLAKSPEDKAGAPPLLYILTSDLQKRMEVARQLGSFFLPSLSSDRPTSRHYVAASRLLDRLMAEEHADYAMRENLISRCSEALDYAWHDENKPSEDSLVGAFIERENARLCYVRKKYSEARFRFEKVKEQFLKASLTDELDKVDFYLRAIDLRKDGDEKELDQRIKEIILAMRDTKSKRWADNPLFALLFSLLDRDVSNTMNSQPETAAIVVAAVAAAHQSLALPVFQSREEIRKGVLKIATSRPIEEYTRREVMAEKSEQAYVTARQVESRWKESTYHEDKILSQGIGQHAFAG